MKSKLLSIIITFILVFSAISSVTFITYAEEKNESTFEVYLGEEYAGREIAIYNNTNLMTTLYVGESGNIVVQGIKPGSNLSLKLLSEQPIEITEETNENNSTEKEGTGIIFYIGLVAAVGTIILITLNEKKRQNQNSTDSEQRN